MERSDDIKDFNNLSMEEKILRTSGGLRVPSGKTRQQAWKELSGKIEALDAEAQTAQQLKMTGKRPQASFSRYFYWAAAAGIALILGVAFLVNRPSDIIRAELASHVEHMLPDGSSVVLNAGSKIMFDSKDFASARHLKMKGEAFFRVEEGSGFVIKSHTGIIEVLGTSFNVYDRSDRFEVTCLSGTVQVKTKYGNGTINAGESVKLSGQELVKTKHSDNYRAASWINGAFHYREAELRTILDEIERQFDVSIETPNIEDRYFTGSFHNNDLEEALEIICIPLELKYEFRRRNRIIITRAV